MKFFYCILIVLFITIGCTTKSEIDSGYKCEEIFVDPDAKETINRSEIFSLERIITLENTPTVGNVNDLLLHKDFIIVSSDDISLYDYEGNFLRNIGNAGRGPGEYRSKLLNLDNGNLSVMDPRQQKLMRYRLEDGKLMSEEYLESLGVYGRAFFQRKGMNLIYVGNQLNKYNNKKLLLFDENINFIDSYFDVKEHEITYLNFIDKTNFYTYGDSVRFLYAFSDGIFNLSVENGDPTVIKRFCVNFGDHSIPESFFRKPFRDVIDFETTLEGTKYAGHVMGFFETDHSIMFMFRYGSERLMGVYSKETKETVVVEEIYDDLLFNGLTISPRDEFFNSYFFDSDNGSIYYVLHTHQLMDNIEKIMERNPDVKFEHQIMDIYNNANAIDNPLVLELKINKGS